MLAILLLFVVGMSALLKRSASYDSMNYIYTKAELQSEIDYLNSSRPEGYELQTEKYEYMLSSGKEWDTGSWEYEALEEAWEKWKTPLFYQSSGMTEEDRSSLQNSFDETMRAVEAGDWKEYAQLRLDQIASESATEEEKEADSYRYRYMLEYQIEPDSGDWRESAVREASEAKKDLALMERRKEEGLYVSEKSYWEAVNREAVSEYRLENGIENYIDGAGMTGSGYWTAVLQESMLVTIVSVIMIVLAGGCVANEFANGTIKFLLVNPVSRRKIIVSKYLTMLILALGLILGVYMTVLLVNLPFFGADFSVPCLTASEGSVMVGNSFLYGLQKYLTEGVSLVAMTTMAFMISSMVRSSALAIGIGVTALMGGSVLVAFLSQLGCDWGRYLIFANLSLSEAASGNTVFPNQSLGFSVVVLAVHIAVFLVMAYDGFTRKEV